MTYDNEAIVRDAYHKAEGNVVDVPDWIGSFTEDGVFNSESDGSRDRNSSRSRTSAASGSSSPTMLTMRRSGGKR